jgi:hypothetical protein
MIVHNLVLAMTWSSKTSRRLLELGFLAGLLGGIVLGFSSGRRLARILGGLLVAVAFGLAILAIHFGMNPFRV